MSEEPTFAASDDARRGFRLDLGLAVCGALTLPGQRRSQAEIAAFCGCSPRMICHIEKQALARLRAKLHRYRDPALCEAMEAVLNRSIFSEN